MLTTHLSSEYFEKKIFDRQSFVFGGPHHCEVMDENFRLPERRCFFAGAITDAAYGC
jgi:hypothetical protein